jgi:hypothetical protein
VLTYSQPVVHYGSAYIGFPDEIEESILANHRDLCRFSDGEDPGYKRIARRIIEFVADATASDSWRDLSNLPIARELAADQ